MALFTDSPDWQVVAGTVVQGHQVASGGTAASPYPRGTIEMQLPHFQARGLDLGSIFLGTLNVSIAPWVPRLVQPDITLPLVKWSPPHPPETFSFSRCWIEIDQQRYDGWIYYPHPETKPAHFQAPSTLEVLAPTIAGLAYGDSLQLGLQPQAFELIDGSA
jgi:hypothetical protein